MGSISGDIRSLSLEKYWPVEDRTDDRMEITDRDVLARIADAIRAAPVTHSSPCSLEAPRYFIEVVTAKGRRIRGEVQRFYAVIGKDSLFFAKPTVWELLEHTTGQ